MTGAIDLQKASDNITPRCSACGDGCKTGFPQSCGAASVHFANEPTTPTLHSSEHVRSMRGHVDVCSEFTLKSSESVFSSLRRTELRLSSSFHLWRR